MAFPKSIREAARRLWLEGYSYEKIVTMLDAAFPDDPTPRKPHTIIGWSKADDWEADAAIIGRLAEEKRREILATDFAKLCERQTRLLDGVESHISLLLKRIKTDAQGKPVDTDLSALEISQIVSALDRVIKNQRLLRGQPTSSAMIAAINLQELTDAQLQRIANGEPIERVLSSTG